MCSGHNSMLDKYPNILLEKYRSTVVKLLPCNQAGLIVTMEEMELFRRL